MKNVRKQMLNNEMPPSCMKCYREEDAGSYVYQTFLASEYWSRRVDVAILAEASEGGSSPPKIRDTLDLRLGSLI